MDFVHRLPFMLSAASTIIVGLVGFSRGSNNQNIFLRMAVCMVVFYVIGLFLRKVIFNINDEVAERLKKEEELRLQQEREAAESTPEKTNEEGTQAKVDYRVSDENEEFSPLKVSDIIKTEPSSYREQG